MNGMRWEQHYSRDWYKDWEQSFERIAAWWRGAKMDRPVVRFGFPRKVLSPPPPDTDWERYHSDPETVFRRAAVQLSDSSYFGEAMPCIRPSFGHTIGSFLGCGHRYDANTVWTEPCLRDIKEELDLTAWRSDAKWIRLEEMLTHFVERARGRCGVGYYLGGVTSAMALMRGTSAFLIDLIDRPEAVESLRDRLLAEWFVMAEELEALLPAGRGYWIAFSVWAPRRPVFCECDVSGLFSEEMFRRFVVPEVQAMARWADFSFYHLDGPGAKRHLEALLEIPELGCIQWIRGAGGGRATDWLPLLRRIQDGGKRLYVECPVSELRTLVGQLRPDGLMIDTEGCNGPRDAKEVQRILCGS